MIRIRLSIALFLTALPILARTAPTPEPSPGGPPNVFYGGVHLLLHRNSPVLLFVHGLGTNATYWFTGGNDMYQDAYDAGYRTAFVSLNADNSDNSASIAQNAVMLQQILPDVLAYYGVASVTLVCHSKGGLDAQEAMMSPAFLAGVNMVFTLATPNQGDALADWAYGPGQGLATRLGIVSPALQDLQTSFVAPLRAQFDPLFAAAGIPFFTLEGDDYKAEHSVFYAITGGILGNLVTTSPNDGLVAEDEVPLPTSYALDMGQVAVDHTYMGYGATAWSYLATYLPAAN